MMHSSSLSTLHLRRDLVADTLLASPGFPQGGGLEIIRCQRIDGFSRLMRMRLYSSCNCSLEKMPAMRYSVGWLRVGAQLINNLYFGEKAGNCFSIASVLWLVLSKATSLRHSCFLSQLF